MRVRIVCYEDVNAWILGKFALKLEENIKKLGVTVDIAKVPDSNADINHHIVYVDYIPKKEFSDTLMITHVDTLDKLNRLKRGMDHAKLGICMSKQTMETLILAGIPKEKLCYVNPAHDFNISPKKFVVGFSSNFYIDGRKRDDYIQKLSENLSPGDFSFKIMGKGWESVVRSFENKGFEITYYDHFDYDNYLKFIPSLDYYLYTGQDEGQMGFIDALAAGVKTIVTPQGYHLDAKNGITHSFNSYDELLSVFSKIAFERKLLINSVADWSWKNYGLKHKAIWEYLLYNKNDTYGFKDGLSSLLLNQNRNDKYSLFNSLKLKRNLVIEEIRQFIHVNHRLKFIKKIIFGKRN